jgi:hypothetical protein
MQSIFKKEAVTQGTLVQVIKHKFLAYLQGGYLLRGPMDSKFI